MARTGLAFNIKAVPFDLREELKELIHLTAGVFGEGLPDESSGVGNMTAAARSHHCRCGFGLTDGVKRRQTGN